MIFAEKFGENVVGSKVHLMLLYRQFIWLSLFFISFYSVFLLAAPADFNAAKKIAQRIYSDESETFYCGCPLRWVAGKGQVDLKSCGYEVRKNGPRAQRIEWEHVMPAQQFGAHLACWQQGGRDNCGDSSPQFQQMEADLFNLKPAIGEVNGDRAHFRFAMLPNVPFQHGACPIRIDFARKLAEPRAEIRGDIARIYFYMADRYGIELSHREQQLMLNWHQTDPVDDRERQLHQRIAQQMGHPNLFVTGAKEWFLGYQVNRSGAQANNQSQETSGLATQQQVFNQPSQSQFDAEIKPQQKAGAIMGNRQSKKYHLAHCPGFQQVKVANQQFFTSEAEAKAAGYQKAGNCR